MEDGKQLHSIIGSKQVYISYLTLIIFYGGFVAFFMNSEMALDISDYLFVVVEVKFICGAIHFMECRDKHNLVRIDQINKMNEEL